jgi:hypothetical protein
VFWSSPNGFEPLASRIEGQTISADVMHFSQGFVGTTSAANIDGGQDNSDASALTDASDDGATKADGCACAAGLACCGGACRDLSSDHSNCGACGKACTQAQTCLSGYCGAGF